MAKYCEFCGCESKPDIHPKEPELKNWPCPLLDNKNICEVCCELDLNAGMGAPDTFEDAQKKSGKTPQEVFATCAACEHFIDPNPDHIEVIYERPGAEESNKRFHNGMKRKYKWLKDELKKDD